MREVKIDNLNLRGVSGVGERLMRDDHPMLPQCCASVADGGLTLKQRCLSFASMFTDYIILFCVFTSHHMQ